MTEKTERFTVKLLPTDKQALERLAYEEGESMGFVIRKLIRQANEQQNAAALQVVIKGKRVNAAANEAGVGA